MTPSQRIYYAKKAFALWPGIVRPISAPAFAPHYQRRGARRGVGRAILDAVVGVAFKLWLPWRTRQVARKHGCTPRWRANTLAIARTRFVDPNDIALFGIAEAGELDHYIRRFEDAAFNKILNPMGWSPACGLVDKRKFYARCAQAGLPHPRVHAIIQENEVSEFRPGEGTPLLVKPVFGEGGDGVAKIPDISPVRTAQEILELARPFIDSRQPWIVQEMLSNHPAIAIYGVTALVTARLTTIRNEDAAAELVSCVLRMPSRADVAIDNMKAGGFIMPISPETGRVGTACKGYGGPRIETHPVSNKRFDDCSLPDWENAIRLACQAHDECFCEYTLIGWDVAFTPDGPMLVEGNAKPGVLMPQRASGHGLASQRYGELLAFNLARAERHAV